MTEQILLSTAVHRQVQATIHGRNIGEWLGRAHFLRGLFSARTRENSRIRRLQDQGKSYDVVTLRYIYGHVTYTGMLHIRATLRNPNDTTTNGVSNYTKSYTVDMLKNPS